LLQFCGVRQNYGWTDNLLDLNRTNVLEVKHKSKAYLLGRGLDSETNLEGGGEKATYLIIYLNTGGILDSPGQTKKTRQTDRQTGARGRGSYKRRRRRKYGAMKKN
jgi:hypothetical protein